VDADAEILQLINLPGFWVGFRCQVSGVSGRHKNVGEMIIELSLRAYLKIHIFRYDFQTKANGWWERFATAIKIDRIPLFDVSRHGHGYGVIGRSIFHASA